MTRNMSPTEATERYLRERKNDVSDSTYRNHSYALNHFTEFCAEHGIEYINDIDGFDLADFRLQRQEVVQSTTVYNNLTTVRTFIRWCEYRDLVQQGLADGMTIPDREGEVRETKIDAERAEKILQHLERFEYASFRHALFSILWDTRIRAGTVRGIDLRDFHPEENYVEIHHRPETDTPLKNGNGAERYVNLHSDVSQVIEHYIQTKRKKVTDDYGREPLLTTRHGRPAISTIQNAIHRITQPCFYSRTCPHNRDIDSCEATSHDDFSKCPSSLSPHSVRRGAITEWLNEGHHKELLSDRMDVSEDILEKHYDARTESEKRKLRKDAFDID
jgi:site-specific recombinase XerD